MRILEHGMTYIVLSFYLLTLIHWKQHRYPTKLELDFALMCGLRIFARSPIYHLPGSIISATLGFVCLNLQPKYELSSSTRFSQFQKYGKIWFGAPFSPDTTRKNSSWVWVFAHGYWRQFDLPSSINCRDIRGAPRGSRVVPLDSTGTITY